MSDTGRRHSSRLQSKRKAASPPPPPPSSIDLTSSPPPSSPTPPHHPKRPKPSYFSQTPRRVTHARLQAAPPGPSSSRRFDYSLPYATLDLRAQPELYRVGVSEQGVLLVQPYKAELLPLWRFRTPADARQSSAALWGKFEQYRGEGDLVGMDMARKYLQVRDQ